MTSSVTGEYAKESRQNRACGCQRKAHADHQEEYDRQDLHSAPFDADLLGVTAMS